jgi:PAS domain S-box-containing protein
MNDPPTERNRRILVIDDNRAIHDDFRKILSPGEIAAAALDKTSTALFGERTNAAWRVRYEIDSAYQGQEGVRLVKQALENERPYAMAFVDVRMPPGWDGVETTQRILEIDPDIQIVICTAYADYSWEEMFKKIGNRDGLLILKKPFDTVEAFQLAHALTEKWWLHQQSRQKMEELEGRVAERTRELQQSNHALQTAVVEHTQAEEKLRGKTAFLEAQVNSSIDGMLVVDQYQNTALQNQRFVDLFKIPQHIADEAADENRLRWVTDMTKHSEQFVQKVLHLYSHPNEISRDEIELKDGTTLDRYSCPVVGKDGKYYGRIWTFRDITERKQTEESLRKSERKFQGLFESSRDAIMTVEPPSWKFTSGNPACLKMFRAKNEEQFISLGPGDVSPERQPDGRASAEKAREMIETALREGSHFFEWTHRRLDGGEFPADVLLTRMEEGGKVMLQATVRDITERKSAERQLSIEYAMSRILAESSTVEQTAPKLLQGFCETLGWDVGLFWRVDNREGLLRCAEIWSNPNIQADEFKTRSRGMTIVRGAGLAGRVWANNRPAWIREIVGDADFLNAPIAAQIGVHSAFAFPMLIGNEVGAVVEFFSLVVREQDDALLRTCATLASQLGQFFERKRVEDRLLQSQKMETVGKLAGGIAHEFNSIMTAIIGHSELLLLDLPTESLLCKDVRQIRQAADRAAALTRQLLAYGRKQILQPGILDLNSILAGMENVLRHLAGNNGEIRITPGAGLKAVKADAGQIEQVIVNIAMNAAEAMPNGGTLSLETANVTLDETYVSHFPELKAGEYVMLAISDTGVGMSEAVRTRVFEPFFSTKPVGQGTGLGLATCYGILKQSGGHISVYSEPARGSTFKIYLPQVEMPAKIPVQRIDTPDLPRGTETILLVEDDPALREMAATLLTRLGYAVLTAANGVEALSLKQQRGAGHVDLLFTDVVMPHMSGKELADRVRVLYPHTRILFTSAYTENSIVHQGVLDPGVALLQKPFTPGALARKVREVLDRDNLASAP